VTQSVTQSGETECGLGWVMFGRINYDLSPGLARALGLRSVPEIIIVTRSATDQRPARTPVLRGDLARAIPAALLRTLRTIPLPNSFTVLKSQYETFYHFFRFFS
jgi:hypothetical protein